MGKKYFEEIRKKVVERYLEGHSSIEVGKEFKISYGTVIRWVHEAGYSKSQMTKKRLENQLKKGENRRGKMKKDVKRKLDQIEIYCKKIEELSRKVNEWISDKGE